MSWVVVVQHEREDWASDGSWVTHWEISSAVGPFQSRDDAAAIAKGLDVPYCRTEVKELEKP